MSMAQNGGEVLAYLGNSRTRLSILEALVQEDELSRSELMATVETSRTTLWRLVKDFEERGWVREIDEGYSATSAGRLVLDRVHSLQATARAVEELGDLLQCLELEAMDFPIEQLADAKVVRPTTADPQGPMRLAVRQIREATDIDILSRAYSPRVVEAIYEPVLAGEQTITMVLTDGVLEAFNSDDEIRRRVREMVGTDYLRLYRAAEPITFIFAILDGERIGMGIDDHEGRPQAVLDIEDPEVVDWAIRTHERYRSGASPVGPERFSD